MVKMWFTTVRKLTKIIIILGLGMRLIAIFVSLVLAVVAIVVVYQMTSAQAPSETSTIIVEKPVEKLVQEPTEQIYVAQTEIAPGSSIEASVVDRQDWPKRLIADNFMVVGKDEPTGMIARGHFQAREPLLKTKLGKPGDASFLASTLPEGSRLVTIATDGIAGIAGFVFPGDRVDILLTQMVEVPNPKDPKLAPKQEQISEVMLVNVLVVAVDQRAAAETGKQAPLPSSVSLQVTSEDAQKLRLAERRGTLSLSLRSLKDKDGNIPSPTTRFDITRFLATGGGENAAALTEEPAKNDSVVVVRGTTAQTVEIESKK